MIKKVKHKIGRKINYQERKGYERKNNIDWRKMKKIKRREENKDNIKLL